MCISNANYCNCLKFLQNVLKKPKTTPKVMKAIIETMTATRMMNPSSLMTSTNKSLLCQSQRTAEVGMSNLSEKSQQGLLRGFRSSSSRPLLPLSHGA